MEKISIVALLYNHNNKFTWDAGFAMKEEWKKNYIYTSVSARG